MEETGSKRKKNERLKLKKLETNDQKVQEVGRTDR